MAVVRDGIYGGDRTDRARDHGRPGHRGIGDYRMGLMTLGRSRELAGYDVRATLSVEDLVDDEEAL